MISDYHRYDALGLAELVARGDVSADELLDEALRRVDAINGDLNAVTVLSEEPARRKISDGLPDGPFKGVPFLLKDLGAEAIAYPTNNGSRLFANSTYKYDSEIFLRFCRSGLVPFGRTASPELGIGPVTEAGVYGGPTRNPWNLNRTSGGSSGGAGAVVAAGILPAAHGSDGGGSVRIPAASCGLVGYKPTRARLPDGPGAGEGWAGMAIDGVLTRSLRDTAALLDACRGPDLGAPYWAPPMQEGYVAAMEQQPAPLRVRYMTTSFTGAAVDPACADAVHRTAKVLEEMGHEVAPFSARIDIEPMMAAWTKIVACGTALSVMSKSKNPADHAAKLDGVTRGALVLAEEISGADYLEAVGVIHAFGRHMEGHFQDFDILMSPTLAEPPAEVGRFKPDNEDFADYRMGPGGVFDYSPYTAAFNASGQPAVSLPLHWTGDNLPVGIHLAAAFGADEMLMSLSARLEEAMPWATQQQTLLQKLWG